MKQASVGRVWHSSTPPPIDTQYHELCGKHQRRKWVLGTQDPLPQMGGSRRGSTSSDRASGAPSSWGMDRAAADCQAWVQVLLTPSQTVGPTHDLVMSCSPLRDKPWTGQGTSEECVRRRLLGAHWQGMTRRRCGPPPLRG